MARTPSYFITKKWNYDPKARRIADKANAVLVDARDRLIETGFAEDSDMDSTRETIDAVTILNAAIKQVQDTYYAARRVAEQAARLSA